MCLLRELPVDREWVGDPAIGETVMLEVVERVVAEGTLQIGENKYTGPILHYKVDGLARLQARVTGIGVSDLIVLKVSVQEDPRLRYLIMESDQCFLTCGGKENGCTDCKQEQQDAALEQDFPAIELQRGPAVWG